MNDGLNEWHTRCDQNIWDAERAARGLQIDLSRLSTYCWRIRDMIHDGPTLSARVAELEAEKALEPLSDIGRHVDQPHWPDEHPIHLSLKRRAQASVLNVGDLRRIRATLAKLRGRA